MADRPPTPVQSSPTQTTQSQSSSGTDAPATQSSQSAASEQAASSAAAVAATASASQSGPSADAPNASTSAPAPLQPDAELRRGAGGFSALVGAFMNGFRQAMTAQQEQNARSDAANATISPLNTLPEQVRAAHTGATAPAETSDEQSTSGPATSSNVEQLPMPTSAPTAAPSIGDRSNAASSDNAGGAAPSSNTPQTLFFRMPFTARNGQSAVLAFTPGPIPVPPEPDTPAPVYGPERPPHLGPERGNGMASGFHLPSSPIFVPHGASPLPFSFLFDTQTNTGWPIAVLSFGPPGAMPAPPGDTPQFMAGPPFHIALNISFGPPPQAEQPNPERAARFVESLERADAELRSRMARLSMGDIGDFGGRQDNEAEAALGCGICLDEYPADDRPEWIGGQASIDEEVVAVPCAGHHTLHHRCLYEWLANTPPSLWTCPFCRAPLDKGKVEQSAPTSAPSGGGQSTTADAATNDKAALKSVPMQTLRDEVRVRERNQGWRCDSPACLPRYPTEPPETPTWPTNVTSLVSLLPCRHKMHVDCLCTSMRLEQADMGDADREVEEEEEEEETAEDEIETLTTSSVKESAVVGKWVKCPLCRHEAWAELPARRRPKRTPTSLSIPVSAQE